MTTIPELNADEVAQLREILAEREPIGAAELAFALRADQQQALDIEAAKKTYWSLILDGAKLDLPSFTRILSLLGRRVQLFESDCRAAEMQRRAEQRQEVDRVARDEILSRSAPAQEALDAATAAIYGANWQQRVNAGELVQAPYLVDLERGTVTTIVEMLRKPCADLQAALAGISEVFTYGWKSAPTHLADARERFDAQVAANVERQRLSASA